ncbi:hypothetical protein V6N13_068547 [Hibiscus sabdariffa]
MERSENCPFCGKEPPVTQNPAAASNWPGPLPFPSQAATTTLLGKGAKQWRSGDWMCAKCNNHNYASRAQCNRQSLSRDIVRGSPNVKWESIKGLENAKRLLKGAIVMPIKYPK